MKVAGITFLALVGPVFGSLFFEDSRSDKIKANLANIGYEVVDSAGLVKDGVIESFDKQSLDDWLAAHGVYDAGNQALDIAKQHKEWLLDDIKDYANSGKDGANKFIGKGKDFYTENAARASQAAWNTWSDSKLKEFLDARGFNVPQGSTRDQLIALVARAKHNSPINFNGPAGRFWFDGWSREELVNKLHEFDESIEGTRKELAHRLYTAYTNSFEAGKEKGDKAAEELSHKLGKWREATAESFNSWSVEDLKDYLSEFGSDVADKKDALVKAAKDNYYYFVHGEVPPQNAIDKAVYHVKEHFQSVGSRLRGIAGKVLGSQSFFHVDL